MNIIPKEISYAPDAFRMLRGCICLYKPSKKGFEKTRLALTKKITNELNSMECRSPRERIEITGDLSADYSNDLNVEIRTNLADHPLVSGQRYNPKQIPLMLVNNPGWYASGIMVGFIGSDAHKGLKFKRLNLPKLYEIKGEFGLASLNYRDDGKVRMKSSYKHIQEIFYERILSKIEAAQRSLMFKAANVNIQSEDAYRMAIKGDIRPNTKETMPLIMAIKPISFEPPNFSFHVQCRNEHEDFLAELVNEIGIALKSCARCTGIRLIQYGPFTVEHSLLQKHWTLENLIENIHECQGILKQFEKQYEK
ncbi:tRNA pseudouridine synthase-like protein [Euroglyphus maynei]|uniref:tRNA pseudouridine synthase-like protein n=1 Tax=Euroglyphus maynei TaxID=6958 RepID=A0A1Y3BE44_EURMA|nr:tRNA pseudouridine synthase-like protein [Euroglyphus maynei]